MSTLITGHVGSAVASTSTVDASGDTCVKPTLTSIPGWFWVAMWAARRSAPLNAALNGVSVGEHYDQVLDQYADQYGMHPF